MRLHTTPPAFGAHRSCAEQRAFPPHTFSVLHPVGHLPRSPVCLRPARPRARASAPCTSTGRRSPARPWQGPALFFGNWRHLAWRHRQGRRRSPGEEGKARGGTERERAVERAAGWGGERGRCPTGCRTEKVCGGIDLSDRTFGNWRHLAWRHRQGRRRSPVEEGKARGGTAHKRAVERAAGWGGERGGCPTGCRTEKVCGGIDLSIYRFGSALPEAMLGILYLTVFVNLFLALLNLLPIPTLDGAKIISSILPPQKRIALEKISCCQCKQYHIHDCRPPLRRLFPR